MLYFQKKAKSGSVGYDLYIPKDTFIQAGTRVLIPSDIAIQLPHGFVEVDELDETERGSGGFGSTGTN